MDLAPFTALLDTMTLAAEAADGARFARCFTEDATYHDYIYGPHTGRADIAHMLTGLFRRDADVDYRWEFFDPVLNGDLGYAWSLSSFTSLVPTHYVMMLGLPAAVHNSCETGRVTKLMISSAPARKDTKREIMAFFQNSGLFELYGSTEAGWVTMLHPDEQFTKLGSVGRECVGSAPIKLLDDRGQEVKEGEVGELYSQTPYTFEGYWKLPEKTRESFQGNYCTVGDMARRDEDGFYYLVDRKSNLIISGGENVYPSEVEEVLGSHPAVKEVAVIGLPDAKWGERVHGVVVLRDGVGPVETELMAWCRERLAGYKRPRSIAIIPDEEMPRTATGKVQHRVLKSRIVQAQATS